MRRKVVGWVLRIELGMTGDPDTRPFFSIVETQGWLASCLGRDESHLSLSMYIYTKQGVLNV